MPGGHEEVYFPLGGVSENFAYSKQPPGTCRESDNFRGIDCKTGRTRGASRPGFKRHVAGTATGTGKIQNLSVFGYASNLISHTLATTTDLNFDTGGGDATLLEWQKQLPNKGPAHAVREDRAGNVFVLSDGAVYKFGADGAALSTIVLPARTAFQALRHVEVHDLGVVFVVARHRQLDTGVAYAYRLVERDDVQFYELLWEQDLGSVPIDFSARGSLLTILIEIAATETEPRQTRAVTFSSITTSAPIVVGSFVVPVGPAGMHLGRGGELYVACPAMIGRVVTPSGFTAINTDASPHEVTSTSASAEEIYAWCDASTLRLGDGEAVSSVPFRREWATSQGAPVVTEIHDDTERALLNQHGLGDQRNRFAPVFDLSAFGEMPGIRFKQNHPLPRIRPDVTRTFTPPAQLPGGGRGPQQVTHDVYDSWEAIPNATTRGILTRGFENTNARELTSGASTYTLEFDHEYVGSAQPLRITGQGLTTLPNTQEATKTDTSSALPNSRALIPSHTDSIFMVSMVLRFTRDTAATVVPQIVFQHQAPGIQIALLANCRAAEYAEPVVGSTTSGWLTFIYSTADDPLTAGRRVEYQYAQTRWDGANNETDAIILTFIHNSDAREAFVRVNGEVLTEWVANASGATNAGDSVTAFTNFGGYVKPYRSDLDYLGGASASDVAAGLNSFEGALGEVITYLGPSSTATTPHDTAFAHQNATTDLITFPGGVPAAGQTSYSYHPTLVSAANAAIWHKIEGILAHKWGLRHILPNGLGGTFIVNAVTYNNDHPFGGNSPVAGTLGTGIDSATEAIRSDGPITAKYAPDGGLRWAVTGHGMGYAVTTDPDGDVYTTGTSLPVGHGFGATAAYQMPIRDGADSNVIARKLVELGNNVAVNIRAEGQIGFTDAPADGESFVLTLSGTATTFTFRTTPGVGTDILRTPGDANAQCVQMAVTMFAWYNGAGGGQIWEDAIVATADEPSDATILRANHAYYASPVGTFSIVSGGGLTNATITDFATTGPKAAVRVTGSWEAWETFFGRQRDKDVAIRTDADGDLYVPLTAEDRILQLRKIRGDSTNGAATEVFDLRFDTTIAAPTQYRYQARDVAFDPSLPVYSDSTLTGPEFIYVATDESHPSGFPADQGQVGLHPVIHKVRIVKAARNAAETSARRFAGVAVRSGNVQAFTSSGGYTAITGGTGALDASSTAVTSAVIFGKLYLCDLMKQVVYDPAQGTVVSWVAAKGLVPKLIRVLAPWRGRLVAVPETQPTNWFMSRNGDPDDWDENPDVATSEQPISGSNRLSIGRNPDMITALVPWHVGGGQTQPLLLVGGAQSVRCFIGDPMAVALGGYGTRSLVEISTEVGIAFGQGSTTQDPEGQLYFVGSRGGVFYLSGLGTPPMRISLDRIERSLQSVDQRKYRATLTWSYEEEGMYLLYLPVDQDPEGSETTPDIGHWFWDKKNNAWWPVSFSNANLQPTAVCESMGDVQAENVLLTGCVDGTVRAADKDALDDDTHRIDSSVLLGPISKEGYEVHAAHFQAVLATGQHGCRVECFVTESPDAPLGAARWNTLLGPGQNPFVAAHATGSYLWLRLRNASVSERFAVEAMSMYMEATGPRLVRS